MPGPLVALKKFSIRCWAFPAALFFMAGLAQLCNSICNIMSIVTWGVYWDTSCLLKHLMSCSFRRGRSADLHKVYPVQLGSVLAVSAQVAGPCWDQDTGQLHTLQHRSAGVKRSQWCRHRTCRSRTPQSKASRYKPKASQQVLPETFLSPKSLF